MDHSNIWSISIDGQVRKGADKLCIAAKATASNCTPSASIFPMEVSIVKIKDRSTVFGSSSSRTQIRNVTFLLTIRTLYRLGFNNVLFPLTFISGIHAHCLLPKTLLTKSSHGLYCTVWENGHPLPVLPAHRGEKSFQSLIQITKGLISTA